MTINQVGIWEPNITDDGHLTSFLMSDVYFPTGMTWGETYTAHFTFLSSQYDGNYEFSIPLKTYDGQIAQGTFTTPIYVGTDFKLDTDFGYLTYPVDVLPHDLYRTGWWSWNTPSPNSIAIGYSNGQHGPATVYIEFGNNPEYNGSYSGVIADGVFTFNSPQTFPNLIPGNVTENGMIIGVSPFSELSPPRPPNPRLVNILLVFMFIFTLFLLFKKRAHPLFFLLLFIVLLNFTTR